MDVRMDDRIIGPVTVRSVVLAGSAFLVAIIAYNIPSLLGPPFPLHTMENPLDDAIPLIKWMSIFYVTCYSIWVINYVIAALDEDTKVKCFFLADLVVKMICMLAFIFYPMTIDRPVIEGDGFFDRLMDLIYTVDSPINLMPSMHCTQSWFAWIAVRNNDRIPKWYKVFTLAFVVVICISTFTVKQHYVLDAIAGVLLAEAVYQLVSYCMKKKDGSSATARPQ